MAPTNFFSNLSSSSSSTPSPKLYLTTGHLPDHVSNSTPPSASRPPFRQIHANPFIASAILLLPPSLAAAFTTPPATGNNITPENPPTATTSSQTHLPRPPLHGKIHLPLSTLLSKTSPLLPLLHSPAPTTTSSNITIISAGTPGVDDRFHLHSDGTLTIDVSRPLYERMGIPGGVAVKSGARKHGKLGERMRVEVDLKRIGTQAGGKMWGRWWRAVEEVWVEGLQCWVGVEEGDEEEWVGKVKGVLEGLGVEWVEGGMVTRVMERVRVPRGLLTRGVRLDELQRDEEGVWSLVEWADLVALGSPRVKDGDRVDDFVARYEVPEKESAETITQDVVVLRWEGLMSARLVVDLLLRVVKASRTQKNEDVGNERPWTVLSVNARSINAVGNVDGCCVFLQPDSAAKEAAPDESSEQYAGNENSSGTDEQQGDGMDVDVDASKEETIAASSEEKKQKDRGLRRFMCCQFMDSRAHI